MGVAAWRFASAPRVSMMFRSEAETISSVDAN